MFDVLWARCRQGHRTMKYPDGPAPELPERFVGRPALDGARCQTGCRTCAAACPVEAIQLPGPGMPLRLDTGRCLFCRACETACPAKAIVFTRDHRLAAARRDDLMITERTSGPATTRNELAARLFRRSLKLRQVSAGGCNACEADTNVLGTIGWDLGRFGIQFVASPRHADGLLITGPVTQNMRLALEKTYHAVPAPKIVIAVGACAIAGGPYAGHPEVVGGAPGVVPVDLFVPGCPPHPLTILDALLGFLGRQTGTPG
jgi:Ni,Fe-hydrogenase III small subunit/formate hydrogenlyase subunit 6/NADH:ubiquinone oxidoreductase subunit I